MKSAKYALVLSLGLLPLAGAAGAAPVTDERLTKPEPQNWLMTRGNYQGWSYSELDKINTSNVKKLIPVWTLSTGVGSGHESPPIVNDGVMYVSTPYNQVIAVDAKTGDLKWRYKRELPEEFAALHNTNRGVGLYGDKVIIGNLDATVTALDAKTGKDLWTTKIGDWKIGEYSTTAPLIVKGKALLGLSGGEFGVRGAVTALDLETGKVAWKTYTVPEPGQPGSDTWRGDDWKHGGASIWMPGNYDPESDTAYFGTGNASPWFGDQRPGDNLFTSSTLALDPATGKMKGYFQYHWNDSWDWDEMNAPMVVEYKKDGQDVKGLVKPARNGYLYWLERKQDGGIGFVNATNYVKQDVFKSIDPKTGRPTYNEENKPGTGKKASFCPSLWGGKDWPFEAYNPKTGMVYIPANTNHCGYLEGKKQEYVAGKWWTGVAIPDIGFTADKNADHFGEIQAWDINAGKKVWTQTFPKSMNWGSILTTGGGLIFAGGTNDRMFRAFDAKTGDKLWEIKTNSGIMAPPSTFEVDGKQYVSVVSGWGVDPEFQQGLLSNLLGWPKDVPVGGVIWVFAVQD